jgi:predicted nuclease of predicted toxin-antitoxin system
MPKKFYKHKLLLDENFPPRQLFPMLNHRFDLKHFIKDLKMPERIPDPMVYHEAIKRERILVTFNGDDFTPLVTSGDPIGVIAVSDNLPNEQIDRKLTALLLRSTPNSLRGKITTITGES